MSILGLDSNPQAAPKTQRFSLGQFLLILGLTLACVALLVYIFEDGIPPQGTPASARSNPDAVQGFGANWLLVGQANRNHEVVQEVRSLGRLQDFEGVATLLRARTVELDKVIAEVEAASSYSMADKRKILAVLSRERDWALSSYIGLKSLD